MARVIEYYKILSPGGEKLYAPNLKLKRTPLFKTATAAIQHYYKIKTRYASLKTWQGALALREQLEHLTVEEIINQFAPDIKVNGV